MADLIHLGRLSSRDSATIPYVGGLNIGPKQRRRWIIASVIIVAFSLGVWKFLPRDTSRVPEEEYSIAVVDFRDLASPDDSSLSASMTELVNTGLIENCPIRVVSPEYLRDLRRRLFGSGRGVIEDDQVIEVAQNAGATLLLAGRISDVGEDQFVTWRLVDTRSGESVGARRVDGGDPTDVADRIIMEVLPLIADVCGVEMIGTPTSVDRITTESEQAYRHFVAGLLFKDQMKGYQARDELERAVAIDPEFALAHLELARLYWGQMAEFRDADKASGHLERAQQLENHLGVKDRLRAEATHFDQSRQLLSAVSTYDQILERWPDDREAILDLANILLRYWDFKRSLVVAKRGLEFYPDDHNFAKLYTSDLIYLGRPADVLNMRREYAEQYPSESDAWDDLALCFLALGMPDSAEAAVRKGMELDPANPELEITLSYCAYSAGELGKAISITEQYLTRSKLPPSARRWRMTTQPVDWGLAALYGEAGRYQDMISLVEEARQYSKGAMSDWALAKGLALLHVGRSADALEFARDMEGQYDDVRTPFHALRVRSGALIALGDLDAARQAVGELYGAQSQYGAIAQAYALKAEAEIALADNRPVVALDTLEKLEHKGLPTQGLFKISCCEALALAYEMAGRLEEAAHVHRELLRVNGGHALSHYALGRLNEEMGRPEEAIREYTAFLEMWIDADEGLPQLEDARLRLTALSNGNH